MDHQNWDAVDWQWHERDWSHCYADLSIADQSPHRQRPAHWSAANKAHVPQLQPQTRSLQTHPTCTCPAFPPSHHLTQTHNVVMLIKCAVTYWTICGDRKVAFSQSTDWPSHRLNDLCTGSIMHEYTDSKCDQKNWDYSVTVNRYFETAFSLHADQFINHPVDQFMATKSLILHIKIVTIWVLKQTHSKMLCLVNVDNIGTDSKKLHHIKPVTMTTDIRTFCENN